MDIQPSVKRLPGLRKLHGNLILIHLKEPPFYHAESLGDMQDVPPCAGNLAPFEYPCSGYHRLVDDCIILRGHIAAPECL